MAKVKDALGPSVDDERIEVVGPQASGELLRDGLMAICGASLAIMVDVWFRFERQFGLAADARLIWTTSSAPDPSGLFSLALGLDFDLTTVAALLTIAGYSVNDTVVVFDRHRERTCASTRRMPFNRAVRSVDQPDAVAHARSRRLPSDPR